MLRSDLRPIWVVRLLIVSILETVSHWLKNVREIYVRIIEHFGQNDC
jgi:hypothetical protein